MKNLHVVFSHGKASGPWGMKIRTLAGVARRLGGQVTSDDYRALPEEESHGEQSLLAQAQGRVAQLLAIEPLAPRRLVLVGSSMGGYVSAAASARLDVAGLFLLAPAFFPDVQASRNPAPVARRVEMVHGWSDAVVPVQSSIDFARRHRCELHLVDADHGLHAALPRIEVLFELFLRQVIST